MEWLARSARPEKGQTVQTYARHCLGVRAYGERFLLPLEPLLPPAFYQALRHVLGAATDFHDLGKLDLPNQSVLDGSRKAKKLPIAHWDAGTVHLLAQGCPHAAVLVSAHHTGLPDCNKEANRGNVAFRPESPEDWMQADTATLLARHAEALGKMEQSPAPETGGTWDPSVFFRMALSLLVDADHTDSSAPNRPLEDIPRDCVPPLLPDHRLAALDAYVSRLPPSSERAALRRAIYAGCRNAVSAERLVACDSPVGSGKTTAVMAHLLSVARQRGLRRVFVVLPFTNIIRQSAATYRKALVLPGENPEDIVAEVHHLADFKDEAARDYAVRWNAPVVVTTAVAFFETLAAATPSALRRLHELAGSAVFVDEAHAALPAKLLPLAWRWMQTLADDWNVHWVLASGSLVHFWEMPEIHAQDVNPEASSPRKLPLLSTPDIREKSGLYEQSRVRFETLDIPLGVEDLLGCVSNAPGPRLVIVNTVQNAASIARSFAKSGRFNAVFHLSTALTPADREIALAGIKARLEDDPDGNWVLVGTSCIEAGIDLDFATGFREVASLASLLQASGRINREGKRADAVMYSFRLASAPGLNSNPGLEDSARVLQGLLAEGHPVSAELCTEALRRELRLNPGADGELARLVKAENRLDFPEVERGFKVIASDTRTVVVDPGLASRLESFQPVDWRDIQRNSVQLWGSRLDKLRIPGIANQPGLYKWNLGYSPFLGCMEGILPIVDLMGQGGGVL